MYPNGTDRSGGVATLLLAIVAGLVALDRLALSGNVLGGEATSEGVAAEIGTSPLAW